MLAHQPMRIRISGYNNDEPEDYERLFKIANAIRSSGNDVLFDFNECQFLAQNTIAFMGGLTAWIIFKKRKVSYSLEGISSAVRKHINDNGFLEAFQIGNNTGHVKDTAVPFKIDVKQDEIGFINYLLNNWLLTSRIDIGDDLKQLLVACVSEAYLNVFHHANSPIGVSICGQYFPNKQELDITLIDFGVGIPYNVNNFLPNSLTSPKALLWALKGNTTTTHGMARGLGLKILKNFVQRNSGKLEIYSDTGYVLIDKDGEKSYEISTPFNGIVIQVTLRCDWNHYNLEGFLGEISPSIPLFGRRP